MVNKYQKLLLILTHLSTWDTFIYRVLRGIRTRIRVEIHGMYSFSWYPAAIKEVIRVNPKNNEIILAQKQFENIFKFDLDNKVQTQNAFKVLTKEFNIEQFLNSLDHHTNIDDEEFNLALHRFQFIPLVLSESPNLENVKWLLDIIDGWNKTDKKNSDYAFSSYSVSERLVSFVILNCAVIKLGLSSSLVELIDADLARLKKKLEYPASGIINNHILNNARALYIAGSYIGDLQAIELSKKILKLHLPEMLGISGVLLENSTHYQLLLTKNMLEVTCVADAVSDKEFFHWMAELVKKMLHVSLSFKPKHLEVLANMPCVGDISPDMSTDWFDPSLQDCAWTNLWQISSSFYTGLIHPKELEDFDGWKLMQTPNWYVLTNTHLAKIGYPSGHGHEDWGSICLYYKGFPIVVDPGRSSYEKKNSDIYANNHTGILYENEPVIQSAHGIFSYLSKLAFENLNFSSRDSKIWFWEKINLWQRKLVIKTETLLLIEDKYFANGNYQVIFPITYLAKIEKINSYELQIEIEGLKLQFTTQEKHKLDLVPYSQTINYGSTMPAYKIILNSNSLNEVSYSFKIMEQ